MTSITYTSTKGHKLIGGETGDYLLETVSTSISNPSTIPNALDVNTFLTVNGTLTRAISSGVSGGIAEYSGFSATNYLDTVVSNSELEGATDFYIAGWFKQPSGALGELLTIGNISADAYPVDGLHIFCQSETIKVFTETAAAAADFTHISSASLPTNHSTRFFLVVTRVSGDLNIYIDIGGTITNILSAATNTALITGILTIGTGFYAGNIQSATMLRMGTTVPTLNQLQQVYDSEVLLFNPSVKYSKVGDPQSIDIRYTALSRSLNSIRNRNVSLSGNTETILTRNDVLWDITTIPLLKTSGALYDYTTFIDSAVDGQLIVFDPEGSVASPVVPTAAYLETNSYSENRSSTLEYYNVSFKVREA